LNQDTPCSVANSTDSRIGHDQPGASSSARRCSRFASGASSYWVWRQSGQPSCASSSAWPPLGYSEW